MSKEDLLERYPGALSFRYRHAWGVSIVGGALLGLILIVLGVVGEDLLQGHG